MKGRLFGQYRITGVVGRGGMGTVYAAQHTLLDRPAAVKVLLPAFSGGEELVKRLFDEARATAAIRHPSIVEIYDFGRTDDGAAFIVMEYLQGESLRARCARGRLPWGLALAVTRQIAGALDAAHRLGIVHRDLKPENVFLVHDPEVRGGQRVKLLDFGIAQLASDAGVHPDGVGMVMGTPKYMAPEQCRGLDVDERADLYALGCILFELCAGRPPFVGGSELDLLTAHVLEPPPELSSLVMGIPGQIDALVQRMLAKSPDERVQTAEEVIRVLNGPGCAVPGRITRRDAVVAAVELTAIEAPSVGEAVPTAVIAPLGDSLEEPTQPRHIPPALAAP